ncbi:MAG: hypothetical protein HOQ45_19485 [Nocardioidaceae bacterium]|nr:hypothetical protein [Nocardioidaceae bacterium]
MDVSGITRSGVVLPVRMDPTGLSGPKRRESAGPDWRGAGPGWFVPAWVDDGPQQRIVEAATRLPATGGVTGWAGLHWGGGRYFNGLDGTGEARLPVPLALDNRRRLRPQPGIELCEEFLADGDITTIDGLPVTLHERSVCRLLRTTRSLERRVAILDMAAFDDLCSLSEILDYAVARLSGRPYVSRIWSALPLAHENSWSPREPVMRLVWTLAGRFPTPLVNAPIFDLADNHLVTPDLLDPVNLVAGEYDGAVHEGLEPRRRDLNREELYRELGLELVTMLSTDDRDRSDFLRRLASAYDRAARRPAPSGWTLEQPSWWVDTSTVARRRSLTAAERAIWLRRQATGRHRPAIPHT